MQLQSWQSGVTNNIFIHLYIDLIGPLPETVRCNKYVMTFTCLFSKWPEAFPLKNKTATGVAEGLYSLFMRYGCCTIKICDQGREFVNSVNDELGKLLGIRCNITSE